LIKVQPSASTAGLHAVPSRTRASLLTLDPYYFDGTKSSSCGFRGHCSHWAGMTGPPRLRYPQGPPRGYHAFLRAGGNGTTVWPCPQKARAYMTSRLLRNIIIFAIQSLPTFIFQPQLRTHAYIPHLRQLSTSSCGCVHGKDTQDGSIHVHQRLLIPQWDCCCWLKYLWVYC
jgi:hypothetical protein